MKRVVVCVSIVLAICGFRAIATDTSRPPMIGHWKFSATCDTPSTTLDGTLHIVFDSADIIVGAVKIEKRTIPFHGRMIGERFVARSDNKFTPIIRIDAQRDTSSDRLSGMINLSQVRAEDHHHKKQDYENVTYLLYATHEDANR